MRSTRSTAAQLAARKARAQRLAAARQAKNLTQADAGRHLGLVDGAVAIHKIETGNRNIDVDELMALCELYGVSVDSILRGGA